MMKMVGGSNNKQQRSTIGGGNKMNALMLYTCALILCFCCLNNNNNSMVESFSLYPKSVANKRGRIGGNNKRKQIITTPSVLMTPSGGATDFPNDPPIPVEQKKPPKLLPSLIAEFIGTFLIVQIGCGTVCTSIFHAAQIGLWQIAAVWSIAVTLAISCTASISGAHLNPAITLAMAWYRKFEKRKVVPYVVSQVLGAVAGAGVNFLLFKESIATFELGEGIVRGTSASIASARAFGEYWSVSSIPTAFFAEAYGTALLAFAIFALTHPKNKTISSNPVLIPPLIGMTVGALISVIAPLTQAGFNPARDFGPRIVSWLGGWGKGVAMQGWWLYVAAPCVGALVGAGIAERVLYKDGDDAN